MSRVFIHHEPIWSELVDEPGYMSDTNINKLALPRREISGGLVPMAGGGYQSPDNETMPSSPAKTKAVSLADTSEVLLEQRERVLVEFR